jgi:adenylate cyclase
VRARLDLLVSDLGEKALKNIIHPVRVYALEVGKPAEPKPDVQVQVAAENAAAPEKPSIAVLPFQNMSGDAEQDYFADGISEDIITALSKLSQLFVIARNSSFTFKGRNVHVREIGKTLGVRYVLEGSVRKAGNRVRITAQLIDATNDGHLWAERFDRDLTDIFAVQDDVTGQIVAALSLNLMQGDRRRMAAEHTDNMEAFDCFLRGRELWWRHTKEPNSQARGLLLRATELDPSFAPAFAWLAAAHVNDYVSGWTASPSQSLELALEAATRAATLDPRYPYTHWALSFIYLWMRRYDESILAAETSIALNPNFADGYNSLGVVLHYVGRSEDALSCLERAVALDPMCPGMVLHFHGQAYFQLRRYEEAAAVLKRRIFRFPETDASRVLLAACYGHMDRVDEARDQWREALRVNPDYSLEHRRKVLPYKNPADFEAVVEGLRKRGWWSRPEGFCNVSRPHFQLSMAAHIRLPIGYRPARLCESRCCTGTFGALAR